MAKTSRGDDIRLAVKATDGYPFTLKEIVHATGHPSNVVSAQMTHMKHRGVIVPHRVRGEWILTNPRKEIPASVLAPAPAPETEVSAEDLTLDEIKQLLTWFVEDYIKCKRDLQDINAQLQRAFGELRRGKIISNHRQEE